MNLKKWFRKLIAVCIQGGAHGGAAWLAIAAGHASGLDVPTLNLKELVIIVFTSGLIGAFKFLDSNPLPEDDADALTSKEIKP